MKLIKTTILALVVLISTNLDAQVLGKNYGKTMYTSGGYANIDAEALQKLMPANANVVKNNFSAMGFGGSHHIKGFVIGINGDFLKSGSSTKDRFNKNTGDVTSKIKMIKGTLNFGYTVIDTRKIKLFPTVGVGHSRLDLNITDEGDLTLDQLTNGEMQGNEYNLVLKNILFDFGLNFNFIHGKEKEGITKGFLKGIRVGYQYGLESNNWKHEGGELTDAISYSPNGLYAQMTIGFGKFSKQKMSICSHACSSKRK